MKNSSPSFSILIVPFLIPYPATDGGKICIFGFINSLRTIHRFEVLLTAYSEADLLNIRSLQKLWPEVAIHTVNLIKPVLSDSFFKRFHKRIEAKIERMLVKLNIAKVKGEQVHQYNGVEIERTQPFYSHSLEFIGELSKILLEKKFDIIQAEMTQMLNLIHLFPTAAKKVFVQIEGWSDVLYDYAITSKFLAGYNKHIVSNAEFLEYSYLGLYDAVFTLNENDKEKIQKKLPFTKVYNSPYGLPDVDIKEIENHSFRAENLIFIGADNHYPNIDAVEWFLTGILPRFKTRPFNKLFITGNWSKTRMEKFKKLDASVQFTGFVKNLEPYLKNSISIVPVRIGGGGIRTKILTSMIAGSPVVATSLSSIGIEGTHKKELLIADNAEDFVKGIEDLFENESLTNTMINNGHKLVKEKYSQRYASELRNKYYLELVGSK